MVTKSFDYLLSSFNSLNTAKKNFKMCICLRASTCRPGDKFSGSVAGANRPSTSASLVMFG